MHTGMSARRKLGPLTHVRGCPQTRRVAICGTKGVTFLHGHTWGRGRLPGPLVGALIKLGVDGDDAAQTLTTTSPKQGWRFDLGSDLGPGYDPFETELEERAAAWAARMMYPFQVNVAVYARARGIWLFEAWTRSGKIEQWLSVDARSPDESDWTVKILPTTKDDTIYVPKAKLWQRALGFMT